MVCDYPDVFPDELPSLLPDREVKFKIDLLLGASPICKAPYRLAPSEIREMLTQIPELLNKGLVRPSSSP